MQNSWAPIVHWAACYVPFLAAMPLLTFLPGSLAGSVSEAFRTVVLCAGFGLPLWALGYWLCRRRDATVLELILTVYLTYTIPFALGAHGHATFKHMTMIAIDYVAVRNEFVFWMLQFQTVALPAVAVACRVLVDAVEFWRKETARPFRLFPFTAHGSTASLDRR